MAYCKKCGAYIPIDETVCPACGYDPDEEAKKAEEARKKAEEEERLRRQAEERRARQEEARRREEERRKQQSQYSSGTQSQYASQHSGQSTAYQSQNTSQHAGQTWVPPWQQQQQQQSGFRPQNSFSDYSDMRDEARESVDKQKLSILSYLGPLWFIPLIARNNDDFARYHTKQGLALLIFNGLMTILGGETLAALGGMFSLFCMVKGIGNVLKGKKEPLPLIGRFFQ